MKSADLQAILELNVAERIQLVEDIWDSIAASPDSLPVTTSQRSELDRRYAEYQADPTVGRSWEEIRDTLDDEA